MVILEETFSKEPLGPAVRDGDSQWAAGGQLGRLRRRSWPKSWASTADNVDSFADTDNAEIRRLLGLEIEGDTGADVFDAGLGLEPGWAANVIAAVGNYGEIFDRNVGPDTLSAWSGESMPFGPTVECSTPHRIGNRSGQPGAPAIGVPGPLPNL